MLPARMRAPVVLLCALLGCDAEDEPTTVGAQSIEFLQRGTLDPLPADTPIDVYVRTQGAFGCEVDIRVYGVPIAEAAAFSIGILGPSGHVLADQRFLPTSTAVELEDGSFAIADLPIVFFDDVEDREVQDAPATLQAAMMTTPPTTGELDVVLALDP